MKNYKNILIGLSWGAFSVLFASDMAHAVEGTVRKIDTASKTITVDTATGASDTFHYLSLTAVHGTKEAAGTTDTALNGLKEGDKIAVHYTTEGADKTVHEVDRIGEGGLHATEGTISHFDRGAKTMAIKTAHGGEETFALSDRAAKGVGTDLADGAKKSTKVTIYYADEGTGKVIHFIKRIV